MPTYEYHDDLLKTRVTPEIEARAVADVELDGNFSDEWKVKLVVWRVYLIICMDKSTSPEDAFAMKMKYYKDEYKNTLLNARARSNTSSSASLCCGGGISGVRLFRG